MCAGFSGNTDLSRAQETANEVRRVIKNLKECQGLGQLYNQRERLFGQDVTQVDDKKNMYNVFFSSLIYAHVYFTCVCVCFHHVHTCYNVHHA